MSFLCYLYLYGSRVDFVLFVLVGACVIVVLFALVGACVIIVLFVFVGGSCRFCIICICRGLMSFLCYLYL